MNCSITILLLLFLLPSFSTLDDTGFSVTSSKVAVFHRTSSVGKISRSGAMTFLFTCTASSPTTTRKVRFELKTSEKILFTKVYPCLQHESIKHSLSVKMPDAFIFNFDAFQTKMSFEPSVNAVLSVATEPEKTFISQDSLRIILKPVYQRPFKNPPYCLVFHTRFLFLQSRLDIPQCPLDNDRVEIVGSRPVVLTKKRFGVVKKLPEVENENLWREFEQSNFVLSILSLRFNVFLMDYPMNSASVFHHMSIGGFIKFSPPLLFVQRNGDVLVEVTQLNGKTEAFTAHCNLDTKRWYEFTVVIDHHLALLHICGFETGNFCRKFEYTFKAALKYSPYSHSLVVGGSNHFVSIAGYICNFEVFLNKVINTRSSPRKRKFDVELVDVEIAKFDSQCSHFLQKVELLIDYLKARQPFRRVKNTCSGYPWFSDKEHWSKKMCPVSLKLSSKHKFIRSVIESDLKGDIDEVDFADERYLSQLGRALYLKARLSLGIGLHEFKHQLVPYILQSSCLGSGIASYMASVIYFSGFGAPADEERGSAYLLRAAFLDDKLALLSLGFKHFYGLNGYPVDYSVSWRYYVDAAWLFHHDREDHKETDVQTETVRLTDKKALEMYLGKESDHFHWLRMQASQGIQSARRELSQILFWGSRGLDRDMGTAVEYYRQLADDEDPIGQFDLGIVLLRGQGVEKDEREGLSYLKRAAAQGHDPAISALGWHYLKMKDYKQAHAYLLMGANKGNPDAMHNLGYMYQNGLVVGEPKNNTAAYIYFIDAANLGQTDSAVAVSTGQIYGDGIMIQDPLSAASWSRNVAELLPAVGRLLQQGLKAYLKDRFSEALMFYMMAAETGVEVASFNMAFLCENNEASDIAKSYIGPHCALNYYNMSLNSFDPHPLAINKVADYHFFGCSAESPPNLETATSYYIWAAEFGDAQAYYNLAYLLQQGYQIGGQLSQSELEIPADVTQDNDKLLMYMFEKCEQLEQELSEDTEGKIFTPCFLARHNWMLSAFARKYQTEIRVVSICVFLIAMTTLCYVSSHYRGRYIANSYLLQSV